MIAWLPARAVLHDVRTGRFERTLAGLAAAGAAVTTGEIYTSHDSASFGNKMMWWPIVVVPDRGPGRHRGVVLPTGRQDGAAGGLRAGRRQRAQGTFLHSAGHPQRPGGLHIATTSRWARRRSRRSGRPGRRDGFAGRAAAPRGLVPATGQTDAVSPTVAPRGHPAGQGPVPRASTSSPRSSRWDRGHRRCRAGPAGRAQPRCRSSPPPRWRPPTPCSTCCSAKTATRRCRCSAWSTAAGLGETDGWHYEDMPEDGQAWRETLAASTRTPSTPRRRLRRAEPRAAGRLSRPCRTPSQRGADWPAKQCGACGPATPAPPSTPIPWAWNEIGFGGPGLPAGLLTRDQRQREAGRSPTTTTSTRSRSPSASSGPAAPTTTCRTRPSR